MVVVLSIFRSLKHEKECETKIVTRTPLSGISSPNFHNRFYLQHSLRKQQKHSSSGEILHENCRNMLFKNMRQIQALLWQSRVAVAVENLIFALNFQNISSL